ncbi:MAG: hypothetical protein WA775_02910 [Psychroserpens sp.]|uniref:hypothetical protein n=1 Tax=Psychroserpens sp. TaxID=2020870 RepID=UPI003CB1C820
MVDFIIVIGAILTFMVVMGLILWLLSERCYSNDPEADFYDNYAVIECPHDGERSTVVVQSAVTCEVTNIVCDMCGKTLSKTVEC